MATIKIQLIETTHQYRIKVGKLNDDQYLNLCYILEATALNENTPSGEEDEFIIVNTDRDKEYVKVIMENALKAVKKTIMKLKDPCQYKDVKSGEKFLCDFGKHTVYTKTDTVEYNKVVSTGFEGGKLSMRDDLLVYPINTQNNFIVHDKCDR